MPEDRCTSIGVSVDRPEAIRSVGALRITGEGRRTGEEEIAVETPVAFVYGGHSFAVMLATPADYHDFARGFSLTEDVVDDVAAIERITVHPVSRGVEIHIDLPAVWIDRLAGRRRALAGRGGCGVCGVDGFTEALRPVRRVEHDFAVAPAAVHRTIGELAGHQRLNRRVGAVHAAAFADADGRIVAVREDVGRHNALDKLIGALAVADLDRSRGFVVVSSRCSYEMVHKTAAAGIAAIAAVSAPTSLAVDLAGRIGLGLFAFAREGRFTVYAGADRIRA
jgi:FdhD protein